MNVSHALRIVMKVFTLIHNKIKMKVFINVRCGSYSGGMILVAANTKEEAIKAFREDKDYDWMWYEIDDKIDDMYYGENGWMESTVLTANVDTPQVIAENGYSE